MRSPVLSFEGTEGPTISPTHPGPVAGHHLREQETPSICGTPTPMEDGGLALVTLARPVRVSGKGMGPQPGGGQGSLRPSSLAPSPIICHGEPRRL